MVYYFPAGKWVVKKTFPLGDGLCVETGTRRGDEVMVITLGFITLGHNLSIPKDLWIIAEPYNSLKVWSEDSRGSWPPFQGAYKIKPFHSNTRASSDFQPLLPVPRTVGTRGDPSI